MRRVGWANITTPQLQHPVKLATRKNGKKRNGNIIITINIQEQPDQQEIPPSMLESCRNGIYLKNQITIFMLGDAYCFHLFAGRFLYSCWWWMYHNSDCLTAFSVNWTKIMQLKLKTNSYLVKWTMIDKWFHLNLWWSIQYVGRSFFPVGNGPEFGTSYHSEEERLSGNSSISENEEDEMESPFAFRRQPNVQVKEHCHIPFTHAFSALRSYLPCFFER